jgi:hypothetical protein
LVVATNDIDVEILATGPIDIRLEAYLPFHVGVHGRLEVEAGHFGAALFRWSWDCCLLRCSVIAGKLFEPIEDPHYCFLRIVMYKSFAGLLPAYFFAAQAYNGTAAIASGSSEFGGN